MVTTSTADAGRDLIEAYLPRTLIERWSADPAGAPVWHEPLIGSLMLCDMSGFTAMSERLARLGNEGAELMAGILNRFFSRMLDVADGWGGVQMKFGGDAMLLCFQGDDHASRAVACAIEMQRAMPEFRNVAAGGERHRLRMRVGIHSGSFLSASVGQPDGVLHYMLVGPEVSRTAVVEGEALPGQVVVSPPAAALLRERARLVAARGGCLRVLRIDEPPRPAARTRASRAPAATLRRYLLPPLAAPLAEGRRPNIAAEHRRVTAVFINLFGLGALLEGRGEQAMLEQLDAYIKLVASAVQRHGGFLAASDAAETGDKIIVLFGAPVASERQEAGAMRFALELRNELTAAGLDLEHRIGISAGDVFAGEIGSVIRREYTVIGDSVNLAARLMAAAHPGEIYVSAPTVERTGNAFDVRRLKPLALKGKSAPVHAFRLEGVRAEAPSPATARSEMLGRDAETAALLTLAAEAERGDGRWAYISGDAGIGKSRLVVHVASRLRERGWRELMMSCQSHLSSTPLGAWVQPLRALLGIEPGDAPDEAAAKLTRTVRGLLPEAAPYAPLVAGLLSLPIEEQPMLRFLDAKVRRQLLNQTITGLLGAAARERPLLLLVEDAHVSDAPSRELLGELLAGAPRALAALVTSRSAKRPAELEGTAPAVALHLSELGDAEARRLAASIAPLSDAQVDAVVARAEGNPLFVEELAHNAAATGALPQTVNEVIMARLDQLPFEEKAVLGAAAVAGATFSATHVEQLLLRELDARAVRSALARLGDRGFVREQAEALASHAFTHVLTQEVVYETLLYARRRELHAAIARNIEHESQGKLTAVCGLLLHHFDRAGDMARTAVYAVMTGDRAASVFANREAIDHYGRALAALEHARRDVTADRSVVLERIGDSLEIESRHRAATEAFRDALEAWRRRGGRRPRIAPLEDVPVAAREAALCRKIAVSFERNSDYDESLRWLDEADRTLTSRAATVRSEVSASRSMALFRKGLYREAIKFGRQALEVARRTRDPRRIAYARNMLANSYIEEGSLRQAVRQLRAAVDVYARIDDVYGQAAANNNLGNCYQALGDLAAALRHYGVALEADARMGKDGAIIHNNMGEVLLMQGQLDEAAVHLEQVVRANEKDANLNAVAGLSLVNLCRCRLLQGDLAAADEQLRKGTRLLRNVGAKGLLAEARLQLGELRLAQGRPQDALREARGVLQEARELDARLLEATAERLLGRAYAALGKPEDAWTHVSSSVSLASRAQAEQEQARSLVALAQLALAAGTPSPGVVAGLRHAIATLARMGAQLELQEARDLLARAEQSKL